MVPVCVPAADDRGCSTYHYVLWRRWCFSLRTAKWNDNNVGRIWKPGVYHPRAIRRWFLLTSSIGQISVTLSSPQRIGKILFGGHCVSSQTIKVSRIIITLYVCQPSCLPIVTSFYRKCTQQISHARTHTYIIFHARTHTYIHEHTSYGVGRVVGVKAFAHLSSNSHCNKGQFMIQIYIQDQHRKSIVPKSFCLSSQFRTERWGSLPSTLAPGTTTGMVTQYLFRADLWNFVRWKLTAADLRRPPVGVCPLRLKIFFTRTACEWWS